MSRDSQINISSDAFNSVSRVIDVIDIFEGFFNIITFGLLLTCLLLLINFGAGSIRKRKFEIGVIKAMGGQTQEVGKIFILQLLSVGLLVCLLSSISLFVLSNFVNEILSDAMLFFLKNETLGSLSLIQFNPIVLVCDLCMILGITFVSAIIPLQKLHKIKPINIIKHTN